MDVSEIIAGVRSEMTDLDKRVIVVEIRNESADKEVASLTEEVTWLRRSLWGMMVSILLVFAAAFVGVLVAL